MKYLLWVVVLYFAWRWYSTHKQRSETSVPDPAGAEAGAAADKAEPMVRCAGCDIHLPVSEALPAPGGLHFCSEAHRARHQAH